MADSKILAPSENFADGKILALIKILAPGEISWAHGNVDVAGLVGGPLN